MPIYEYHCSKCGDFEVMQRISDKELRSCPTCRRKVTKLISSTSFQLKGSGWYITDYARKAEKGADADKKGEGDTKSDAKADAKSESNSKKGKSDGAKSKKTKAKSAA